MGASDEKADELLDKLTLDIKAFVLLHGSEGELKKLLQRELARSPDESVRSFVDSLQTGSRPGSRKPLAMAIGELIFASLLVFAGMVALVPVLAGATSPQDLVNFFAGQFYGSLANSPLHQYAGFVEFALGALLMLAAFYTLREAATNLREMGLSIKTGE